MPHRTVFQWGKNHAHPFTVFLGGFVIGALVVGAIMYAWQVVDNIDNTNAPESVSKPLHSPSPAAKTLKASPSPTAKVQF